VLLFGLWAVVSHLKGRPNRFVLAVALAVTSLAFFAGVGAGLGVPAAQEHFFPSADGDSHGETHNQTELGEATAGPSGSEDAAAGDELVVHVPEEEDGPPIVAVFFSIYYSMTGIHAIHILAGMGVIAWILWRAIQGQFSERYYGPVDFTGLYWHLVDLIWIYLFPLLYLIH
jgi:cytochrome c oxidase subunit 3